MSAEAQQNVEVLVQLETLAKSTLELAFLGLHLPQV
jgi:hypothetical protein